MGGRPFVPAGLPAAGPLGAVQGTDWEAVGHHEGLAWVHWLQLAAPWLLLALVVVFLVQAARNARRYRAVEVLDAAAVERLRAAVAAAEAHTVGEVGVVVLERSDRHPVAPWSGAVVLTALTTLALAPWLHELGLPLVVLLQLAFGLAMHRLVAGSRDLLRRFVSATRATETAEEQAIQEFHALRLGETVGRTGVLLFVSLLERRVVVLADEGISSLVEPDVWVEVDEAILDNVRRGRLELGLEQGIERVGRILGERFPAQAGRENQLVDHVVVRRE